MSFSKKTIVITLITVSLFGGLFFAPLQKTKAMMITWDIPYLIDNFVIRPLLRKVVNAIENRMLNQIGNIITDKANGGRDPYWITNWRNHILDSNARGVDVFRAVLADTELCPHFNDNLKRAFGAENFIGLIDGSENLTFAPGTDPFQVSSRCTLSSDVDLDAFAKDFSGGWETWLELVQPQNNFYGAYSIASLEKDKQVAIESQASQDQSTAQAGWKGGKLDAYLGGTRASGCARKGIDNRCTFLGKTVTPGTIFNQGAELRLKQKADQLVNAREIEDMILAIADAVVQKVANQLLNLLDGEQFAERSYQQELESARGARDASRDRGVNLLTCQQQCGNTLFPECNNLIGDAFIQCQNAAEARCILNCP